MAKFLQEHLAPQAQEIDQSNEFKNLRVSREAQTERDGGGGSLGAGLDWAGNCTVAWQDSHSLLVDKSPLRMQPFSGKPLRLIVPEVPGTCDWLPSHNPLCVSVLLAGVLEAAGEPGSFGHHSPW